MNVLLWLTTPLRWVIEIVLVGAHQVLTAAGASPDGGPGWVIAILGVVLVVRAALIPVFVRQIRSQRKMLELAPRLKRVQEKYKGKRDPLSREALSRETMLLYKESGTSPFASCLPLLVQIPVLYSLFETLNTAARAADGTRTALLFPEQLRSFGDASLFGAPLHATIATLGGAVPVLVVGIGLIVVMVATQFFTQLQIMSKNVSKETMESPMYRQQKLLLYVLPLVFIFSGVAFPLGVMFYWVFSNLWTMGQQFIVIRNSPTPGSEAAKAREARLAKRKRRSPRRGEAT